MPKRMEQKLRSTAKRKHLKGKAAKRYIYGTMRKTGWKPRKG